jgi:3-methylfumaryl-CoA hydratase
MNEVAPKTATMADMEALLGLEHELSGIDEVTRSDIRRKLEVYCFDCPLYTDTKVAQAHGYKDIIAPGVMTPLWAMPAYWEPGEPVFYAPDRRDKPGGIRIDLPPVYPKGVNSASEWEFFEPLHPGDRLHGSWKIIDIKQRQTRLGEGAFVVTDTSIYKQTGELVAKNFNTNFRYKEVPGDKEKRERPAKEEKTEAAAKPTQEPTFSTEPVDWSKQLRDADVKVGDFVPPFAMWLNYQRIVMSVAVDRMFSGIHHNRDMARENGFKDIIYNTRSYEFQFECMLRRWIGLDGKITRLGPFRMTGSSYPGDTVITYGKVTEKVDEGKGKRIKLEIWGDNDRGEACRGAAEVALPG